MVFKEFSWLPTFSDYSSRNVSGEEHNMYYTGYLKMSLQIGFWPAKSLCRVCNSC